jgi:hypothetical protein
MATAITAIQQVAQRVDETVTAIDSAPRAPTPGDTVTISPAAQTLGQTVSGRIDLLRQEGESVASIALQLGLTQAEVENILGIVTQGTPNQATGV